ncbi:Neural/ectodermal development factor IMP-L2 [Trichinella pseudospiralis]|uniref:Neural/ectodermal development factor IMP-L2 n=1 Tax=Trichinella pseudospiralis TaxID=6337 RepID=A0A0V1K7H8_TRIPS|nr:Neural/ectodermal development factor IMP-L2 [Trichinella pseudospiralis]KRZ43185.1 Neural/ectodermal development factor IMP-L2 [Trichinella pseudospiralis]
MQTLNDSVLQGSLPSDQIRFKLTQPLSVDCLFAPTLCFSDPRFFSASTTFARPIITVDNSSSSSSSTRARNSSSDSKETTKAKNTRTQLQTSQLMFTLFILLLISVSHDINGSSLTYLKKLLHGKAPYDSATPIQPVKLLEQPSIHISLLPKSVLTVEGTPVSLHCAAHGVPTPVIYWKFNGEYLPQGKPEKDRPEMELFMNIGQRTLQSSNTAGQLEIGCITVDQAGIYECVANNGITEVSAKAVIAVKENTPQSSMCSNDGELPPKIYMWTDFRIEMEDASVQLFCRVKGNPMPEIQWFRGDGKRIINDNQFQILKSGDLLIKRGNWRLAGLYICKAINELGEDDIQTFYYPTANTEEKSGNEKK